MMAVVQIWLIAILFDIGTQTYSFAYILSVANFMLQKAELGSFETVWLAKMKTLLIWPYTKFPSSWTR
jgi:hypothetical protein